MNYKEECPVCTRKEELVLFDWRDYNIIHCNNCLLDYCSKMDIKEAGGNSSPVHIEGIEMMAKSLYITSDLAIQYASKRAAIFTSLLNRKCKNILEIGCGPGVFYNAFKKKSIEWTGIDINPYWKKFGEKNKIPISNKSLNSLSQKYDVIIAYQVIEHVENPLLFIKEIVSKLKPGGIVQLELPNQNSLSSKIRKLSPKISYDYGFIQPPMHLRAYQTKTIKYLFDMVNLKTKNLFACSNTDKLWGQVRKYSLSQKLFYSSSGKIGLGSLIIAIGQKVNK
jgi:SAM-dependent methyltransferase